MVVPSYVVLCSDVLCCYFGKIYSTSDAFLIEINYYLKTSLVLNFLITNRVWEDSGDALGIYCDLSKAFYCFPHETLLRELSVTH